VASASSAGHDSMLRLQRCYGNHYVQKILTVDRNEQGETITKPQIEETIDKSRGGGAALDSGVRAQMESALGADLGRVRIHDGSQADSLNRSLSARAFTTGSDIFFRQGEYQPGSSGGRKLLAHELTHVIQQNSDVIRPALTVSEPNDAFELEADRTAHLVMEQERGVSDRRVSRQALPEEEEREEGQLQRQEMQQEEGIQMMPQPEAEEEEKE